ncbi:phenylacetate--CoA ligase [Propionivibrio sp.]|uniref:phenylacetate--CoA ligase family protein n=1 Tax=Propionivibrio sp. TaxID=2212460 RepID=UPI0025F1E6B1|nr:phenylacetate--CoA ligase [Propionivibrio sp.]MBK7355254.1 phenylacetate--CoA ligase [Propionivibrio sp.]MBK8399649.1 phenylacetate--CoA ligase [Propionivibrio sp.]MBK8744942.1 phenylacetate--CoA ligase [Propionivibrio sp.]MBK8893542.1 phenylacetate--CoA ligase [Propionivibrio sp.]MBL0208629.1 phenylacetate--CoA ligase [Propionivibrio sp.]
MPIWNKEAECASNEAREKQQLERLQKTVERVYARVPFYREKLDRSGINPDSITSLKDIAKLPFTAKHELRQTYPYGLLACDPSDLVEIHTSSGTTGTPVVGAYTQADIEMWSDVMARTLAMAGCEKSDTVQIGYGYGLFTGGLGFHYGARRIGANIIPISSGNTRRQLMTMRDFGTTLLTCTPSYSLFLAEAAQEEGIDFRELPLRAGCFGAEPWSENMRVEIESKLNINAYDCYGLTELIGPGVASECEHKNGQHFNEDYFYPEIVNPETGEVLADGEKGELIITSLQREGTPLLRYRTRDITYLMREPCACGRTSARIHRLLGRTDDMMIIRGVNCFPSQIENVLMRIEGTQPHYQIVIDRGVTHLDEIEIQVEVEEAIFSDLTRGMEQLRKRIHSELKSELGISAHIKLVEPRSITRSEGKAQRIIDKRSL